MGAARGAGAGVVLQIAVLYATDPMLLSLLLLMVVLVALFTLALLVLLALLALLPVAVVVVGVGTGLVVMVVGE